MYKSAIEYGLLAIFILAVNTALLSIFVNIFNWNPFVSKIVVEICLFIFSWFIQKRFVFKESKIKNIKHKINRRNTRRGKEVLN